MFGPDICGSGTRRTHVIFNYEPKNDNLLIKKDVKVRTSEGWSEATAKAKCRLST